MPDQLAVPTGDEQLAATAGADPAKALMQQVLGLEVGPEGIDIVRDDRSNFKIINDCQDGSALH
ncbi:hypothetical protein Ate02nite_10200 [Paractinoplanes tereljensis]|uniref:Uncharacterized protein n=1 Tax=Paractinoplanes tereljensis TaxID=571912 RepID=A0A919TRD9_9ACTN|nr:hypothetical protein Ate02nite_10200 [Actinoplanes tereljensis]